MTYPTTIPSRLDAVYPRIYTTRRILTADVRTIGGETIAAGTEFELLSVPYAARTIGGEVVKIQSVALRTKNVYVVVS